jgi:hypothetical protein
MMAKGVAREGQMMAQDGWLAESKTVDAVGKASEALEYIERARGHLYAFHQLIGRADALFEESASRLAAEGHAADAASLWRNVVGRDVLEGRWTFQIVEGFDDDYYNSARSEVVRLEQCLVAGHRHAHEEMMRAQRRTERAAVLDGRDMDYPQADVDLAQVPLSSAAS